MRKPIELEVGNHVLLVKKNGALYRRYQVTVSRGASPEIVLKESALDDKRPASKPAPEKPIAKKPAVAASEPEPHVVEKASPERATIEWLLDVKATSIEIERNGVVQRVLEMSQVPMTDFHVVSINLVKNSLVRNEDIEKIAALEKLHSLYLSRTSISDDGVRYLKDHPALVTLHLIGLPITDKSLEIVGGISQLEELRLADDNGVTDVGIAHLAGLKNLRHLDIGVCQELTDQSLEVVGGMVQLKIIRAGNRKFTDAGLLKLQNLTGLEEAWLEYFRSGKVTNRGFGIVKRFPKLRTLCFAGR